MEDQIFTPMPAIAGRISKDTITPENIKKNACEVFDVSLSELESGSRRRPAPECRQAIAYLINKHTSLKQNKICEYIGSRDRTTVSYSISAAKDLISTDRVFAANVIVIEKRLEGVCA